MLGGKVIKITQGESAGINPFELEPDTKGNKQFLNILDKVAEIRALLFPKKMYFYSILFN